MMEFQKIVNLLDTRPNQPSKMWDRKLEINDNKINGN